MSRWYGAGGIAFVVLFFVGVNAAEGAQESLKKHDSPSVAATKVLHAYSSSGHRAQMIIGAYLMVLSALALVWFAGGLRTRLALASRPESAAPAVAFGFAVLGAAVIVVSALCLAAVAGSYVFGSEPLPTNADAIRVIADLGTAVLLVGFGLSVAAMIAVVVGSSWRTAVLPRWLSYASILAVLGGILAVVFLPLALVLLWFLAVSVVGLRSEPAATGVAREPPPPSVT